MLLEQSHHSGRGCCLVLLDCVIYFLIWFYYLIYFVCFGMLVIYYDIYNDALLFMIKFCFNSCSDIYLQGLLFCWFLVKKNEFDILLVI